MPETRYDDLRALFVNCTDGNQRSAWDAGARFDFPNPEYR
jgi:hypothetical protein